MSTLTEDRPVVIGGIDTHRDTNVVVVIDPTGRQLGCETFPTTTAGYQQTISWLHTFGTIDCVGVEGTGAWGAGISRALTSSEIAVVDIDRPDRQRRRRRGKNDSLDAYNAALAALSGEAPVTPKSADGGAEALRQLRNTRASAIKARTIAYNQLHATVVTAPESLRDQLRNLSRNHLVTTATRFRSTNTTNPTGATKIVLRSLAQRCQQLNDEIKALNAHITTIVEATAPQLLTHHGVGPHTAAALLICAGDNPHRLRSEAAFAALCGVAPIEASTGNHIRHRLNRGGNRQANNALWRIVMVRIRSRHQPTIDYIDQRTSQGKTHREIVRCLKRYVAREIYNAINPKNPPQPLDNQ